MSTASDRPRPTVLQLSRTLSERPVIVGVPGVQLRQFADEQDSGQDIERDIDAWLEIRHRAFAAERVGVRAWTRDDFRREFLDKPWWSAERLWFAEVTKPSTTKLNTTKPNTPEPNTTETSIIGTVALADRGPESESRPAVHWLAVLPGYRRRGVAQLLMATLEAYCWDRGSRQIALETHGKWWRAVEFYRSLGYREECEQPVAKK